MDATCVQIGLRGRELHHEGGRIPQIYGSYVKSETLDSSRFETKMRQNTPNPISISIFSGDHPWTPPQGALPPGPREGRVVKGRAGRERAGKREGRDRGRRVNGTGGGSLRHCRCGIDAPGTEPDPTRSSADADNRLDAFSGQSRSTNMVPFHM